MLRVLSKVTGRKWHYFSPIFISHSSPTRKKRKEGYEENETRSQLSNVDSGGKNTCKNFKTWVSKPSNIVVDNILVLWRLSRIRPEVIWPDKSHARHMISTHLFLSLPFCFRLSRDHKLISLTSTTPTYINFLLFRACMPGSFCSETKFGQTVVVWAWLVLNARKGVAALHSKIL